MIDAGISLYDGCDNSSELEWQLHPACACTVLTHPHGVWTGPCTERCQASARPARGEGQQSCRQQLPQMFCILDFSPFQPR